MKKLILVLFLLAIFTFSYSQIKFDNGYYVGICEYNDVKYTNYLYLQFLSNGGDSMLIIVPYRMKKNNNIDNEKIMNNTINKYLLELSKSIDNIENYEIINQPWSIEGFDNFTYYELDENNISFSINIADIKTDTIEVFYFDGKIENEGYEIYATIYSDIETFKKTDLRLIFVENTLISKN
jgi:hypothetical protein